MERLAQWRDRALRVLRGRPFAAVLLAVATLVTSVFVSVKSRAVTVTDRGESHVVLTMSEDPYKAVESAGIELDDYDVMDVDVNSATIDISRAMPVEVNADGVSVLVHMVDGNVGDALKRADVSLGEYDTVNFSLEESIVSSMFIKVDRVGYKEYTVTETIPYETVTTMTPVLSAGRTKVIKAGSNGERIITYRQTIVNGEVTETTEQNEQILTQPVTRRVLQGSAPGTPLSAAPFALALDGKNQPTSYSRVYSSVSCTAYARGSRGASGMRLGVGTVAVDPREIPYGTKLWITSADGKFVYGYAVAADTGSFAGGRTFADLYFGSYDECLYFGRRNLNVYVIG